jgi:hypothetical protein
MNHLEHQDLYKNFNSLRTKQKLRQDEFLIKLKDKRSQLFEENRNIDSKETGRKRYLKRNKEFKNILMLSEWMLSKPENIDEFLLVNCPKGIRVTLSSDGHNKSCKLYYKNGQEFKQLTCHLPQMVADCILSKDEKKLYILDIMSYGYLDFSECDTIFRFYWICNKFEEDGWKVQGETSLNLISFCDCNNYEEMMRFFQQTSEHKDELDGFLFYHKLSNYVQGTTPLVLWTFAFMINELFEEFSSLNLFETMKPDDYTNYIDFMQRFNIRMKEKKSKNRTKISEIEGMEFLVDEEQMTINLELENQDNLDEENKHIF